MPPSKASTPSPSPPGPRLKLRDIFHIETTGLRSTAVTVLPLIWGQLVGQTPLGLLIGLGGLQVAFMDYADPSIAAIVCGAVASAVMALIGGLSSTTQPLVAIGVMLLIAFTMAMLAVFGEVAGNIGFVLTLSYAFTQNTSVSPHKSVEFGMAYGLGGAWALLLTLLLWRLRRRPTSSTGLSDSTPANPSRHFHESWPVTLLLNLTPRSPFFRHAVRTALATGVAIAICRYYHPPHGFWIVLTCLVILKPNYAATRRRTMERLGGTVAGGLLAMLPSAYIHNTVTLDLMLVAFGLFSFSHLPRNYGLYTFFLTPFIVLLLNVAAPGDSQTALARIYETLLGGAVAFSIAFLLRSPRHYFPHPSRSTP